MAAPWLGLSVGVFLHQETPAPSRLPGSERPSPSCRSPPQSPAWDGEPAQPAALRVPLSPQLWGVCPPVAALLRDSGTCGDARAAGDTFAGSSHHRRRAPRQLQKVPVPELGVWGGAISAQYPFRPGPVFQPVLRSAPCSARRRSGCEKPAPPLHTGTRRSPHA